MLFVNFFKLSCLKFISMGSKPTENNFENFLHDCNVPLGIYGEK